ncbi:MAG TPA: hydrogenase maturation protease [Anaerolineaceae bacterium]|nr:hydrogenase maturation protease [Anaerolineaceae bacterium]
MSGTIDIALLIRTAHRMNKPSHSIKNLLVIGFGNIDRQDDGVAWHVLSMLANHLGRPHPNEIMEGLEDFSTSPALLFVLQLTPEMAEIVAQYDAVCFVDAHTGSVEEEVQLAEIEGEFQSSPLTHHMTPQTVLALADTLYGKLLPGFLLSIRGYQFGFTTQMSPQTEQLAHQAADLLWDWVQDFSKPEF